MKAFRLLALGYALLALLIAPAWLAAEEEEAPPAPAPVAEQPAVAEAPNAAAEPDAAAPASEPAPAPADEAPVAVAQEPEEPAVAEEPPTSEDEPAEESRRKEPTAKAAASGSVTISDFKFAPSTVTVNVGDSVTWTNSGPTQHTATAEDGSFDTGMLDKGASGSATFSKAGTISYICTPHPFMKGTVVVQAASAGSGGSGSDTAGAGDDDPVATTAVDDSDGLPATGAETLAIALLGIATLAAGLRLRRRVT